MLSHCGSFTSEHDYLTRKLGPDFIVEAFIGYEGGVARIELKDTNRQLLELPGASHPLRARNIAEIVVLARRKLPAVKWIRIQVRAGDRSWASIMNTDGSHPEMLSDLFKQVLHTIS